MLILGDHNTQIYVTGNGEFLLSLLNSVLLPWKLRNVSSLNCGHTLVAANNGTHHIEIKQYLLFSTVEIQTFPNVCTLSAALTALYHFTQRECLYDG